MSAHETIPRHVQGMALPTIGGAMPGPVHTVLVDEEGYIYYSDEFNDTVASLDRDGRLRWQRNSPRTEPSGFFYPRGMSLGWLRLNGRNTRCLAVCDAWKQRVHMLDPGGNTLAIWTRGGEKLFSEPSDVRFIPGSLCEDEGYWIVVDKGNHRACALDTDGRLLFDVGRGLTPALTRHWAIPGLVIAGPHLPPGVVKACPPFDFVFYPERIFGNSEHSLYLWEPSSNSLKQILLGNLFPISVRPAPCGVEWIGADVNGLSGYCQKEHRLVFYDGQGHLCQEILVEGTPVSSNLPHQEFWTQTGDLLDRWTCQMEGASNSGTPGSDASLACGVLLRTAEEELARTDLDTVQKAVGGVISILNSILALTNEIFHIVRSRNDDSALYQKIEEKLQRIQEARASLAPSLNAIFHRPSLAILETSLLAAESRKKELEIASERVLDTSLALINLIQGRFGELQRCLDNFASLNWRLARENRPLPEKLSRAVERTESQLREVRAWICNWSAPLESSMEVIQLPWVGIGSGGSSTEGYTRGTVLCRPAIRRCKPLSSGLREVERIPVLSPDGGIPAQPHSMALSGEGNLFVSLYGTHCILCLDRAGRYLYSIGGPGSGAGELNGPAGLAFDAANRLWVVEWLGHRIQVFDPTKGPLQVIDPSDSRIGPLRNPVGISQHSEGSMLVADWSNSRVIRVSPKGACAIYTNRNENPLDEDWHPISFFNQAGRTIWVVDRGNHQIQKLNMDGALLQVIGSCGIGVGNLFTPHSVAVFHDGVIAVGQDRLNKCLKLFLPSGEELSRLPLDFMPTAMLVQEERLIVSAYDDDSIRVYERSG
jgi:sugar lactone lactonase YvrE